ncbi:MAG TPA: flagellar hook-basal body complex protein, partial [Fimbriimonas sp.]|nr:flagellar hook-basal body complex protein [Fimbriimonas sp.]
MLQAMLSGVASIKAQQSRMNVIGDNLANVNTTAYKGSRVSFAEMMSQTARGASRPTEGRGGVNPLQFGLGVLVAGTDMNNTQGALNQTNRTTDLAIQGEGFFITSNSQRMGFTRDGGFELDASGGLVQRATGERVLGWMSDASGKIDASQPLSAADYISIPVGSLNTVQVTTSTTWSGNLNGAAAATDSSVSQIRVYDALGGAHDLSVRMTNRQNPPLGTAPAGALSSWDWEVWEGAPDTGTMVGSSADTGNERLYFDGNGARVSDLAANVDNKVTIAPTSGNAYDPFTIDLNFDAISQLIGPSQVNAIDQNGFPPGGLQNFSIGQDGTIVGIFTNGLTRPIAQVAMAHFSNPQGMERVGSNLFVNTDNSGFPQIGAPRTGSRGLVSAGFLE